MNNIWHDAITGTDYFATCNLTRMFALIMSSLVQHKSHECLSRMRCKKVDKIKIPDGLGSSSS